MARPSQPLDWRGEVIGRRYRIGEEHPEFEGWFFTGQYNPDGRALWSRPETPLERTRRLVLLVILWGVGVAVATLVASALFGGVLPALLGELS